MPKDTGFMMWKEHLKASGVLKWSFSLPRWAFIFKYSLNIIYVIFFKLHFISLNIYFNQKKKCQFHFILFYPYPLLIVYISLLHYLKLSLIYLSKICGIKKKLHVVVDLKVKWILKLIGLDEWKRQMVRKITLIFTFILKNTIIELKDHVGI